MRGEVMSVISGPENSVERLFSRSPSLPELFQVESREGELLFWVAESCEGELLGWMDGSGHISSLAPEPSYSTTSCPSTFATRSASIAVNLAIISLFGLFSAGAENRLVTCALTSSG